MRYYHHVNRWYISKTSLAYVLVSIFHPIQTPTPSLWTPRQLNIVQMHILHTYRNKCESTTLTTHATVKKKCHWVVLQICVYHVFMYLCKVDYMTVNTFMYVAKSLKYNRVVCTILTSYMIATIVEH